MNCAEAREILLDSLARPIAANIDLLMEDHIASCETCRRFVEIQRSLDARLTAAVPVVSLSSGFRSSLRTELNESHLRICTFDGVCAGDCAAAPRDTAVLKDRTPGWRRLHGCDLLPSGRTAKLIRTAGAYVIGRSLRIETATDHE